MHGRDHRHLVLTDWTICCKTDGEASIGMTMRRHTNYSLERGARVLVAALLKRSGSRRTHRRRREKVSLSRTKGVQCSNAFQLCKH
jgi:hypothetical protein